MFEENKQRISASEIKLTPQDISGLKELSIHVDRLLDAMGHFDESSANLSGLKKAFAKLFDDAKSSNRLESYLATYILNELKNLNIQVTLNNKNQTGFSFLKEWMNGGIHDQSALKKGCKGLCSPAAKMVIRNCKPDLILKNYAK